MSGVRRPTTRAKRALVATGVLAAVLAMAAVAGQALLPFEGDLSRARLAGSSDLQPRAGLSVVAATIVPPDARVVALQNAAAAARVSLPAHLLAWGVTEEQLAAATVRARLMPLDQVAGQVIVAAYSGPAPESARDLVADQHLAGVILMSDNVVDAAQVSATAVAVQQAVAADGRAWPAFIAVDQEGGPVARLGAPFTSFPAFMSTGAADALPVIHAAAEASGTELRAVGLTVDLAPVADVTIGAADPVIGVRSAGGDPATVGRAVVAAQRGYRDAGLLTAVKHFPGHGSVTEDSHLTMPVQGRSLDVLLETDLRPFARAIAAGTPMVMVGHIAVQALDPGRPASLSPEVYRLLRDDLGFTGVAITDALNMGAVTTSYDPAQTVVAAMAAGADLLLMPADPAAARAALVAAVQDGTLSRDRLDQAAGRVIAMMRLQASWQSRLGPVDAAVIGSSAAPSEALSAAAVTVLAGACSGALTGPRLTITGGTEQDRTLLTDAATAAGLTVVEQGEPGDTRVVLVAAASEPSDGDVVVALEAPFTLAGSTAPVRIALYGRTPGAFEALAAVLAGQAPARGHLPVAVGDLPAGSGCPA